MTRHSLRRVRMNTSDQTLHCSAHGLLNDEETREVLSRVASDKAGVLAHDARLSVFARIFDRIVAALPARCVTVR